MLRLFNMPGGGDVGVPASTSDPAPGVFPNWNPSRRRGEVGIFELTGSSSSSAMVVAAAFSGRGKNTERFLEWMRPCRFPAAENADDCAPPFALDGESGELNDMEGARRCGWPNDGDEGDGGVLPKETEGPLLCPDGESGEGYPGDGGGNLIDGTLSES